MARTEYIKRFYPQNTVPKGCNGYYSGADYLLFRKHFLGDDNFDILIHNKQYGIYSYSDFYRPLAIDISGSDLCPSGRCVGCGISAIANKKDAKTLPFEIATDLLEDAYQLGFLACIHHLSAEPFENMKMLKKILYKFNGKLDVIKISTNSSQFTSKEKAVKMFKQLYDFGWTETRFFKPTLSLSVGMQQDRIPLKKVIYGIKGFQEVFEPDEAILNITHYQTRHKYRNIVNQLRELYDDYFDYNLDLIAVIKTGDEHILARVGHARNLPEEEFNWLSIHEIVDSGSCFNLRIDEYINPGLWVKPNGDLYICPDWGLNPGSVLGNAIKGDTIKDVVKRANNSKFFRTIADGGTLALFNIVKEFFPYIGNRKVTSVSEASCVLYKAIESHYKLREMFEIE